MPKTKRPTKRTRNENAEQEATVRPFWSGTLSFGLVSVPVNLFPANRDSRVGLRMLGPEGEPLRREYYSDETGKALEQSDTTRGFETSKGKYVTISDEELERLAPEKSRDIDLQLFVPRSEISPVYFERAYFLTPAEGSTKAYRLLAETMQRRDRAGVATFVMRGKEYLVAIFAANGILLAETMRFSDEIRRPEDIALPKHTKTTANALVKKFDTAIARATKKSLDLKELRDEYAASMLKLVKGKYTRKKDVVESEAPREGPAKVVDLMEILKASLGKPEGTKAA